MKKLEVQKEGEPDIGEKRQLSPLPNSKLIKRYGGIYRPGI